MGRLCGRGWSGQSNRVLLSERKRVASDRTQNLAVALVPRRTASPVGYQFSATRRIAGGVWYEISNGSGPAVAASETYDKASPSSVTFHGAVDVGGGYQSHGARFNPYCPNGVEELISRNSNKALFVMLPNGLVHSNVELKGSEPLGGGLAAVERTKVPRRTKALVGRRKSSSPGQYPWRRLTRREVRREERCATPARVTVLVGWTPMVASPADMEIGIAATGSTRSAIAPRTNRNFFMPSSFFRPPGRWLIDRMD